MRERSLESATGATDEFYMQKAYALAKKAYRAAETPIGCVIVYNGRVIAAGRNRRNAKKNPLYHAEISAINKAAAFFGDWRLEDAVIYVTCEPCPMCAGAIIQSRIKRLVYGARSKKAGCAGSVADLFAENGFNHKVEVSGGCLEEKCSLLLSAFFRKLRRKV